MDHRSADDEASSDVGSPEETNVDETEQDVDKLDFTADGETFGYISLDQARVLALRLAREDISVYGEQYSETRFAWEVTDAEEGEDYYQIRISFRPVQGFTGEPGTELFTIDKLGTLESRQTLTFPIEQKRKLPAGLLALGGIGGISAVIAVLFIAGVFTSDVTGAAGGQSALNRSVTQVLTAEESVTVRSLDGDIKIDVPIGAVPESATLDYVPMTLQEVPALASGFIATNKVFEISITDASGGSVSLTAPVTVEVSLDSAIVSVAGSDPSRIVIQHYGSAGWEVLDTRVDLGALTASADATDFSSFALAVKKLETTPLPPAATSSQGEIAIVGTESGVITAGGSDEWTFEGTAGQVVNINLYPSAGSGLDTYMILNGPSGAEITYNDDGSTGYNSRIQRTLGSTGTYTILARGYNGRPGASTGAYELSLEEQ